MKTELTQERLKELLHYDPDTGGFTWLVSTGRVSAGSAAGTLHSLGYVQISVGRKFFRAHRLAFLYMTGDLPAEVDHINRDKSDNRWKNLRPATRSQNCQNVGLKKSNSSGYIGVSQDAKSGKWVACARKDGKKKFIGRFSDLLQAAEAVENFRSEAHGEFAA